MNHSKSKDTTPKNLLTQARQAALKGRSAQAHLLFETCIHEYLSCQMPMKALAAAKHAKTLLGPTPKIRSLLIRLYISAGLHGDAKEEYDECCRFFRKDSMAILRDLHMEAFLDILSIVEIIPVNTCQCVFNQGESGQEIYMILSGEFEVIRDGRKESVLRAGDLFGELGFFHHERRSATVRASQEGNLISLPAEELKMLCERYACLRDALDVIYDERVLKKVNEDMRDLPVLDIYTDQLKRVHYAKGQLIPFDTLTDITIIKHGIVEINYDEKGLQKKRFLKPGSIIERFPGTARASTDVELVRATVDLLGHRRKV